ncbi:response regulator [Isoalcanivorax beigongshangi]|uniref:Response regulator n=1 Tax=Isoalcanivorax beigongshangi TaxID=3238810 RepID=A0ABV4AIB6_9GAMM
MTARILIIEDEAKLASLLADYLHHAGYRTLVAHSGEQGLACVETEADIDVVLLDLMLPGIDGLEVCKRIRQQSMLPVIMLTARVDEVDRLLGLELGADDYICKPFSPREVVARVKALLRRVSANQLPPAATSDRTLALDENRLEARFQGDSVALTVVEFALLRVLAEHPGHIRSRQQLMDRIYSDNRVVSDRTVDSHIKKLRKRLADSFPGTAFIHSIYGAGYRFEITDADDAC